MVWTDPATDTNARRSLVRIKVGDSQADEPLVTDATMDLYLAASPNDNLVASEICLAIAGGFAREVKDQVGPLREEAEQKFEHYHQLWEDFAVLALGAPPGGSGFLTAGAAPVATNDGFGRRFSRADRLPGFPRLPPLWDFTNPGEWR